MFVCRRLMREFYSKRNGGGISTQITAELLSLISSRTLCQKIFNENRNLLASEVVYFSLLINDEKQRAHIRMYVQLYINCDFFLTKWRLTRPNGNCLFCFFLMFEFNNIIYCVYFTSVKLPGNSTRRSFCSKNTNVVKKNRSNLLPRRELCIQHSN